MTVVLAALDLGSNSFHLLVARALPQGHILPVLKRKVTLHLGDDVGRSGRISPQKAEEAARSAAALADIARSEGATTIFTKATAALRDAANGAEVVKLIEEAAGVKVEVISGLAEAHLVFLAVRWSVDFGGRLALVADLGGGSLELVSGDQQAARWAVSLPLGVGRLTGRLLRSDPPSPRDTARLRAEVRSRLEVGTRGLDRSSLGVMVGTSGTITALARMCHARRDPITQVGSGSLRFSRQELDLIREDLFGRREDARKGLWGLDPKRAATMPAGAVVMEEVMDVFGFDELTVGSWAMREGAVLEALHGPPQAAGEPTQATGEPGLAPSESSPPPTPRCDTHRQLEA